MRERGTKRDGERNKRSEKEKDRDDMYWQTHNKSQKTGFFFQFNISSYFSLAVSQYFRFPSNMSYFSYHFLIFY